MTVRILSPRSCLVLALLAVCGAAAATPPVEAQSVGGAAGAAGAGSAAQLFRDPRRPLPKASGEAPGKALGEGRGKPSGTVEAAPDPQQPLASEVACAGEPVLEAAPRVGGRMQIDLAAPCAVGTRAVVAYGDVETEYTIEAGGRLTAIVDAFVGNESAILVRLADGWVGEVPVVGIEGERVSKVAVLWDGAVDLDLHAFEAAALPGEAGHVWSGAPSSAEDAVRGRDGERGGRGARGFLGRAGKGSPDGRSVEVYTVLHARGEAPGAVEIAIDHASRGGVARDTHCGTDPAGEVAFEVVQLAVDGRVTRRRAAFATAPCGRAISDEVRFDTRWLPRVRLGP